MVTLVEFMSSLITASTVRAKMLVPLFSAYFDSVPIDINLITEERLLFPTYIEAILADSV